MSAAPERTREERFLSWTGREGRKLWDALPTILPVAAGLLFTVSTARSEKFPGGWFFWSGVIITVVALVVGLFQKPSRGELQQQLEAQRLGREEDAKRYKQLVDDRNAELTDAIKTLVRRMAVELGVDTTSSRVTVYLHRDDKALFVPMARHSLDPVWAEAGREAYPDSYGAIATTWRKRFHVRDGYPADADEWVEQVVATEGIPRDVAQTIRMKSVCIAGTRLEHDHHNVGVIIIESVTPWTDESLQNSIQEREGDFAALRDTAAEIIYIVRNSFNDVAAGRPNIH
jgi:hypothetical protein